MFGKFRGADGLKHVENWVMDRSAPWPLNGPSTTESPRTLGPTRILPRYEPFQIFEISLPHVDSIQSNALGSPLDNTSPLHTKTMP